MKTKNRIQKNIRLRFHPCQNRGITLIALVITIIVMLILVAVTITVSINGRLFEYAFKATKKTQNAIDEDKQLENGKINVAGKWYASIADYMEGKELIELPEGIKVGDYVNYTPDKGTYTVASGANGSGYETVQTFRTEEGTSALEWRILSINEETRKIEIISEIEAQSTTKLYLQKADGYNHGVDILNDLCNTLYSKTKNGEQVAKARSVNAKDINEKTTYDYTKYTNSSTGFSYGDKRPLTYYNTSKRKYPLIYEREIGYAPNGVDQTGLDESQGLEDGVVNTEGVTEYSTVIGYIDDYDSNTNNPKKNVYVTYTYYYYTPEKRLKDLGINTAPKGLINIGTTYWLASRCVAAYDGTTYFRMRYMTNTGNVSYYDLFRADNSDTNITHGDSVRPVVELIGANVKFTKDIEHSTNEKTYWNVEF